MSSSFIYESAAKKISKTIHSHMGSGNRLSLIFIKKYTTTFYEYTSRF